jgi:hypothetical protein
VEKGSYLLLEPGMTVRGRDGDLGTVAAVLADESMDIFRGISVARGFLGLGASVFVPGERVTAVEGDVVTVDLSAEEAKRLPPAET